MKKIIKVLLLFPPYFKPRFIASDFISYKSPIEPQSKNKWLLYRLSCLFVGITQFLFFINLSIVLGTNINFFVFMLLAAYLLLLVIRWNQYWGINS